jgi:CHAT domain-containing protein
MRAKGLSFNARHRRVNDDDRADKLALREGSLLTASEISQLKLNADWVVLSACNTTAGDKRVPRRSQGLRDR